MANIPLFSADSAVVLHNENYHRFIREAIQLARVSILATQYVTDARPATDRFGEVRFLCHALAEATWRSLDVRIVLSAFPVTEYKFDANWAVGSFLHSRNVRVRQYSGEPQRPILHTKLFVIDGELVVLGSHNWSPTAFRHNEETSVAIRSASLGLWASRLFEWYWKDSKEAYGYPE